MGTVNITVNVPDGSDGESTAAAILDGIDHIIHHMNYQHREVLSLLYQLTGRQEDLMAKVVVNQEDLDALATELSADDGRIIAALNDLQAKADAGTVAPGDLTALRDAVNATSALVPTPVGQPGPDTTPVGDGDLPVNDGTSVPGTPVSTDGGSTPDVPVADGGDTVPSDGGTPDPSDAGDGSVTDQAPSTTGEPVAGTTTPGDPASGPVDGTTATGTPTDA